MRSAVLIMQARLSSTRLPQKALLPIVGGEPALSVAMRGVAGVADLDILACDRLSEGAFSPIAVGCNYRIVSGDLEDVLGRFTKVMQQYPSKYIIRATGDNLIVGKKLVESALEQAIALDADYLCFDQTPYGSGVEVVRQEALLEANQKATSFEQREHVTAYLYQHPEMFQVVRPVAPKWARAKDIRSTMDTQEDYNLIRQFFTEVSFQEENILEEYIAWMKQRP